MEDTIQQLLNLKTPKEIEQAISHFSNEKILEILKALPRLSKNHPELVPPVLTGLPQELIYLLVRQQPAFFKPWMGLEAMQHKLILITAEIQTELKNITVMMEKLQNKIKTLPPSLLYSNCHEVLNQIAKDIFQIEEATHPLIELSWLSERIDLIDLSNIVKKQAVHLLLYIDFLRNLLKERLEALFGANDSSNAIEGLAAMGLLYPEDWKAFLGKLGEPFDSVSEKILIKKVSALLKKAGLLTIRNLKEKELYNQELLIQFLKNSMMFPKA